MKTFLILSLVAFGLICCQNPKVNQQAEAEKLMALSRQWAKAAASGNTDEILSYWATNATVMSPGQPRLTGHEAIRQMLIESAKIPGFQISWEPTEAYVSESGDMGYVIANNSFDMKDSLGNTVTSFNKGVEIWKRQDDGSWKNVVDIFNADPSLKSIR
jgi:ketosteroid isomerase-like protein